MKKAILTFFLGSAFLVGMAQTTAAPEQVVGGGAQISIDKEIHDYGTIAQGANGTCEFTVSNSGDQPLIISNCKGSCGCTVPKCDTKPVAPGASTVITVRYDTKRIGPINKNVTITSNASNSPTKVVRIKGTVEKAAATPTSPEKEKSPMAPVNN